VVLNALTRGRRLDPRYDAVVSSSRDEFRRNLGDLVSRSGGSMRKLSAAFGRDPGYVASLLDPNRPTRARPTPTDLLRASDVLRIPFVELLECLWGIPQERLRSELHTDNLTANAVSDGDVLSEADLERLADYAQYLKARGRGIRARD
jgi:hypothetical protein